MIIIGITGTLGAGKGTIVELLTREFGFHHYSVRGFLIEEILKRELPVNRDSMVSTANDLRAKNSPSYVTDCLYEMAREQGENSVIESIRTPGEIASLHAKGNFFLFAVDADPRIRYERIYARGSETDAIDFDTFRSNEEREFTSDDPNKQNLRACIEAADFTFMNEGSIEDLFSEVRKVIAEIL